MRNDWLMTIACGAMLLIANHSRPSRGQVEKQNASCRSPHVLTRDTPAHLAAVDLPLPAAGEIIRKNVEEIRVVFSVLDRQGRFVNDITPGDVELKDDDRTIDDLTGFSRSSNLPLRLALLVDVSESMTREFGQEQQAAGDFLRNVVRPEYDQAFVLTFATRVDPKQPYLHEAHVEKLKMHAQSGGQTALYDAICSACLDELMNVQENLPVRRVIVLLSDGEDTQSRHSLPDAVEWAQRAGVAVFAVTVHNARGAFPGDRVLKDLAAASGGRAFILQTYDQLPSVFTEIEGELRAQFAFDLRENRGQLIVGLQNESTPAARRSEVFQNAIAGERSACVVNGHREDGDTCALCPLDRIGKAVTALGILPVAEQHDDAPHRQILLDIHELIQARRADRVVQSSLAARLRVHFEFFDVRFVQVGLFWIHPRGEGQHKRLIVLRAHHVPQKVPGGLLLLTELPRHRLADVHQQRKSQRQIGRSRETGE